MSVVGETWLMAYPDVETAMRAVRVDMERRKFWSNVWTCSDRGNLSLVTDELPEAEED
jgi:hypothetical protein